jgi:hypothetical protein
MGGARFFMGVRGPLEEGSRFMRTLLLLVPALALAGPSKKKAEAEPLDETRISCSAPQS